MSDLKRLVSAACACLLWLMLMRQTVYADVPPNQTSYRLRRRGPLLGTRTYVAKCGDEVALWTNLAKGLTPPKHKHHVKELDEVLILTPVMDSSSWGTGRNFESYLSLVESLDYPVNKLSLGFLVSDKDTMLQMKGHLQRYLFDKLKAPHPQPTFAFATLMHSNKANKLDRDIRQFARFQKERRRLIAEVRNRLLFTALKREDSVLWIDADVEVIPAHALQTMVKSGKDVIATWTLDKNNNTFDKNTWKGPRLKPTESQRSSAAAFRSFIPQPVQGETKFLDDFQDQPDEFVEIDSVGGTVLFVRGEVHRSGVAFPTNYVIGTEWEHEGYDGMETEGLCYTAKFLGYKCWGAPKMIVVHA